MSIQLDAQIEAVIRRKVEAGPYRDATAVAREALRLLDERDRRLQELHAAVSVGLEQIQRGEVVTYTPELREEMTRSAIRWAQAGEQPSADVVP